MHPSIHVHLINPTESGNIGACARAIKNMGGQHLHLLKPHAQIDETAQARASGANDLLDQARHYDDLGQQLAPYHWVIGTTTRVRKQDAKRLAMSEFKTMLVERVNANQQIAFMFGTESSGLTNQQLDHCHATLTLPCSEAFPSLNLSHAVQLLCYEAHSALLDDATPNHDGNLESELAPLADNLRIIHFIHDALMEKNYLAPEKTDAYVRQISQIIKQSQLTTQQAQLFMGMLKGLKG